MIASESQSDSTRRPFSGAEGRAPGGAAIADRVVALLAVEHGDKVLDIGCGAGTVARALARECGCQITCVDDDQAALEALTAAAREDAVEGLVLPLRSDFKALPLPPESFEAVVIEGSLRSLGVQFEEAASLARTFLRPDGLLVLTVTARVGRTLPATVEAFYRERGEPLRSPHHLVQALFEAGFEPLCAEAYSEAAMDAWYRSVEEGLQASPGQGTSEEIDRLRKEIDIFRKEGGRSCVNELLFVARRRESDEAPPSLRGGV